MIFRKPRKLLRNTTLKGFWESLPPWKRNIKKWVVTRDYYFLQRTVFRLLLLVGGWHVKAGPFNGPWMTLEGSDGIRNLQHACVQANPAPFPLSSSAAQRLARMAALLESLLSQKVDIIKVVDWLKSAGVGLKRVILSREEHLSAFYLRLLCSVWWHSL